MLLIRVVRQFSAPIIAGLALLVGGIAGAVIGSSVATVVRPAPADPAAIATALRECRDLATTRIVLRSIQRASTREDGMILSNTDEVLCRLLLTGDYGIDLATITADWVQSSPGTIDLRLPVPQLLAPGFTATVPEILDQRTTRWVSDEGPGSLTALQTARASALREAPLRVHELSTDADVRNTTRAALRNLLPHLLGDPALQVIIRFDDEPTTPTAPSAPTVTHPAPRGAG